MHMTRLLIPHSRIYGETPASEGLRDRCGRRMEIAPVEKNGFQLFFLLQNCLLQFFYCVFYSILTSLDISDIVALFSLLFTIEIHRTLFSLLNKAHTKYSHLIHNI